MKNDFAVAIKNESINRCKPNALDICRDLAHGIHWKSVCAKYHISKSACLTCQVGLDDGYSVGVIQLALYRVINRQSSGKMRWKHVIQILNQAKLDFEAMTK